MNTVTPLAPRTRIPRDAGGWVSLWRNAEIPILEETAVQIEELRAREDDVDARLLAGVVSSDPLMCLKLLAHVSTHRSSSCITDTETATAALVMMGIGPFFRRFGPQPSVQDRLSGQPDALAGLLRVLTRARRAACFALGFAVHRMDHDAEVIHEAALLHDFAEMLLWCHAPAVALCIAERQASDPTLRSVTVQRELLNAELADVQQGLMRAWRLPELLVRISDDHQAHTAQVRNVLLAIRLARHTKDGWDNAAIPDDVSDIAALLNLRPEPTVKLLHELDSSSDRWPARYRAARRSTSSRIGRWNARCT
jgi:HD-like signal output (HDOD) protein